MQLKDMLNLLRSYEESVNYYWNFLTIISLGIVGFVLQANKTIPPKSQLTIILAFVFFAFTNWWRIHIAQQLYIAMKSTVIEMSKNAEAPKTLKKALEQHKPLCCWQYSLFHLLIDLLVISIVLSVEYLQ